MILPKLPNTAPKSLTKANRYKLWARQHGVCPWCGRSLALDDMHAHHRLLRAHGGTWSLSNILGLHGDCHNVQPRSVHQNPSLAYREGFMIRKSTLTPIDIPVFVMGSGWMLADDAGDWKFCLPTLALELLESAGQLLVDTSGYSQPVNGDTSAHSYGENGRLKVFSLTRNGPELDAQTSELGPDQHLTRRCG